ncbi:MAG TPA: hypothetical protein PLT27_12975, partial [Nitrospira sp.]|nr:hypothetical protein [Nitrospira sp.]
MDAQPVMDLEAALERFDGDQDLFLTLAEMFLERSPAALAAIQTAFIEPPFVAPRLEARVIC